MSFPILSTIVFAPLVGAAIIALLPASRRGAIRWVAAAATFVALALSVYLVFAYDRTAGGLQFEEQFTWIPFLGVQYHLAVDGISVVMLLLIGIIEFTGVFVSWGIEERTKEFFITLLGLAFAVSGVFVSFDVFLLFVFFEFAVLPKFVLIAVWGSTKKEYAAMKLALYLVLGSAVTLVGILLLYFLTGLQTFDLVKLGEFAFSAAEQKWLFAIFFVGFAVQVPVWPLHSWLPDAHVAAPTAGSMMLAGVVMKLGAYAIIRVAVSLFPAGAAYWAPIIAVLALINVLYAAFVAMSQRDLKYLIANSSISHMGYAVLGIASLTAVGLGGAVLQLFAHGVMAALLFALVGMVYERTHTREIAAMGGLAAQLPLLATAFVIAGLTSLGLPSTSSFIAEFLVFAGSFPVYQVIAVLAIFGIVITALYILRAVQRVFFGPANEKYAGLKDARWTDMVALSVLIFFIVAVGVRPNLLTDLINLGVQPMADKIQASTTAPVVALLFWWGGAR